RLAHLGHRHLDDLAAAGSVARGRILALRDLLAEVRVPLADRRAIATAICPLSTVPCLLPRLALPERLADLHDVVGLLEDAAQHPGGGGGDLGVDLVGRDLDDRVALLDAIALLLVPLEDGSLRHRLAHRGHLDLDGALRRHGRLRTLWERGSRGS